MRKRTNKLPEGIKAVDAENNIYKREDIESSGYNLYERIPNNDSGEAFTVWSHVFSKDPLIFIEKSDGSYQFGGYVSKK